MRFELGLRELADLTPEEAKEKLAALPKGISTGVILKALQMGQVPSVTIAWSEDKRVINEIEDGLTALGFRCHVIDHGFFVLRIGTALAEAMGRSRYRKVDKRDRMYISLGEQKRRSPMSDLGQHALFLALQIIVIEGLYVWRLGLKVGAMNLASAKDLSPQLAICAAGVCVAYVLTTTTRAWRQGKISLAAWVPIAVFALVCAVGALFYMKVEYEAARDKQAIGRPPSNPYAGLLVELRRRGEGTSGTSEQMSVASHDEYGQDSEALECFDPSEWGQYPECIGSSDWESALACTPLPQRPKRPRIDPSKPVRVAVAAKPKVKRVTVPRPWGVTLELVTLAAVLLAWLLSLVFVHMLAVGRRKASASTAAAKAPEPAVESAETQLLRAELADAQAQLAAQAGSPALEAVRRELADTQASLLAHQNAIAKFKQQVGPIKEMHAAQLAEIERLRAMLQQATGQRPAQPTAAQRPAAPANNQVAPRRAPPGAPGLPAEFDPAERSASPQKRRT